MSLIRKAHIVAAALATISAMAVSAAIAAMSPSATVWICPNDPSHGGAADFWTMLRPDAPWQSAKSRVKVFKIAQNLVTNGPPEQLKQFYAYLKQNHIALAIEIGMLTWSDHCGTHVEGYVPAGGSAYVANRIKSLGGELAYIAMDEPLYQGRLYGGANACHSPIDVIASDIAVNFKAYQAVFPGVRLGDTENAGPPANEPNSDAWLGPLQAGIKAVEAKTGAPLAFFHEDVNWKIPLEAYIPKLSNLLRSEHIPFGMIMIASNGTGPDEAWIRGTEENIQAVNRLKMAPLDQVIFQSWYGPPSHNLPETSPGSLTYLIDYYFHSPG